MKSQTPPKELTQTRLKELLDYEPETGIFTWRVNRRGKARAGTVAGYSNIQGYIQIGVDGITYSAHRLAFLYIAGVFPPDEVDHINGLKADNRWMNLREVTRAENQHNLGGPQKNNNSGYRGVSWHTGNKKWQASIRVNKKRLCLGYFNTAEEGGFAYLAAKDNLHPTHMRLREQADER